MYTCTHTHTYLGDEVQDGVTEEGGGSEGDEEGIDVLVVLLEARVACKGEHEDTQEGRQRDQHHQQEPVPIRCGERMCLCVSMQVCMCVSMHVCVLVCRCEPWVIHWEGKNQLF